MCMRQEPTPDANVTKSLGFPYSDYSTEHDIYVKCSILSTLTVNTLLYLHRQPGSEPGRNQA